MAAWLLQSDTRDGRNVVGSSRRRRCYGHDIATRRHGAPLPLERQVAELVSAWRGGDGECHRSGLAEHKLGRDFILRPSSFSVQADVVGWADRVRDPSHGQRAAPTVTGEAQDGRDLDVKASGISVASPPRGQIVYRDFNRPGGCGRRARRIPNGVPPNAAVAGTPPNLYECALDQYGPGYGERVIAVADPLG